MTGSQAQLALAFPFEARFTLDEFVAGPNEEVVARLRHWHRDSEPPLVWISGAPGSGRTHLLNAVCRAFGDAGLRSAYLPASLADGRGAAQGSSDVFAGLEPFHLVALDDLELWLCAEASAALEERLFALYGRLLEQGGRLLLAAADPPERAPLRLPDLRSRVIAGARYVLCPLGDGDKRLVVQRAAQRRGIELPDEVLDYLFTRSARDLPALLQAIERLDRAALSEQRRVTLPLARRVLAL